MKSKLLNVANRSSIFRGQISVLRRQYRNLRSIEVPVEKLLMGGEAGIDSKRYAEMIGKPLRPSTPVSKGPHAQLLRDYERIGERLLEPDMIRETPYYSNAMECIDHVGCYFESIRAESDVIEVARNHIRSYSGKPIVKQKGGFGYSDHGDPIMVRPISDSDCFEVRDGHHRVARAAVQGMAKIRVLPTCFPFGSPAVTPIQELVAGDGWAKGRRELYQPIELPEIRDNWVTVRKCVDRMEKIRAFLADMGLNKSRFSASLDIASSYGWFVAQFGKLGFQSYGVERDYFSRKLGIAAYEIEAEQVKRSDCVEYLLRNREVYDVTSCFSLLHHFVLGRASIAAEELIRLIDQATKTVCFFDTGQEHEEWFKTSLAGWNVDYIERWLRKHTTFTRIIRLGPDADAVPPFERNYGRMLFALVKE